MTVSVIVPTFNEAPNVSALVDRINGCLQEDGSEIVFVDDSTDDTPERVVDAAEHSRIPVRLIHRPRPEGGLSGAVLDGIRSAGTEWCVVMDGDLQHPPELIPLLLSTGRESGAQVVVASRYLSGGSSGGLAGMLRHVVSRFSGALTKAMFPIRLRNCSDPMTGFFAVRRESVNADALHPRGFKILLEILTRQTLTIAEEPFIFGERNAGDSKATARQGLSFLVQLAALRFGRMSRFAAVGAGGTVLNLLIMAGLLWLNVNYLVAAVVAAAVTIMSNFFVQEVVVFRDLRAEGKGFWLRFAQAVGFNGAETVVRTFVLYLIVQFTPVPALIAQAVTLGAAFLVRFVFQARVVYRPRQTSRAGISARSFPDLPADDPLSPGRSRRGSAR